MQRLFQETAAKYVSQHGWAALFQTYDTDGACCKHKSGALFSLAAFRISTGKLPPFVF